MFAKRALNGDTVLTRCCRPRTIEVGVEEPLVIDLTERIVEVRSRYAGLLPYALKTAKHVVRGDVVKLPKGFRLAIDIVCSPACLEDKLELPIVKPLGHMLSAKLVIEQGGRRARLRLSLEGLESELWVEDVTRVKLSNEIIMKALMKGLGKEFERVKEVVAKSLPRDYILWEGGCSSLRAALTIAASDKLLKRFVKNLEGLGLTPIEHILVKEISPTLNTMLATFLAATDIMDKSIIVYPVDVDAASPQPIYEGFGDYCRGLAAALYRLGVNSLRAVDNLASLLKGVSCDILVFSDDRFAEIKLVCGKTQMPLEPSHRILVNACIWAALQQGYTLLVAQDLSSAWLNKSMLMALLEKYNATLIILHQV